MNTRRRNMLRWGVALATGLLMVYVSGFAVEESVIIHARWTVLPYQTLRVLDADGAPSNGSVLLPIPDAGDQQRGYVEQIDAHRLQIVSNGAWRILVWSEQATLGSRPLSDVWVRGDGGTYFALSNAPGALTHGGNGTFEISVDVRVQASPATETASGTLNLIYLIMLD